VEAVNFNAVMAINRDKPEVIFGYLKGQKFNPVVKQYFSGKLDPLLDLFPGDTKGAAAKSAILNTGDGLAVVAAAPVLPTSGDVYVPGEGPCYLVFVKFLTPEYLAAIGEQYVIQDLKMAAVDSADSGGEILTDFTGASIASLTWTDGRPGDVVRAAVWPKAIFVLGFLALVMVAITILCWRLIHKIAEALKSEAEAREDTALFKDLNHRVTLLNMELEAKVGQLKEAQEEIVRKGKLAQLGMLIATVAHELRNPLGIIRTTAYALQKKLKDTGIDASPQLVRIESGIVRCDSIISQLLDFARSQKPASKLTDVDEWLEESLKEEVLQLPASVTVNCHLGLCGLKTNIDTERGTRAVINLLSNAVEAMIHRGQPLTEMAGRAPQIDVRTKLTERGVEINFEDNGPGIPNDMLDKIREPLFTTKGFGTGLGIPAVEKIMELHGGGLEINSVQGEGACFTIWFPTTQMEEKAA
jgi:signal transduction histidine kinase